MLCRIIPKMRQMKYISLIYIKGFGFDPQNWDRKYDRQLV